MPCAIFYGSDAAVILLWALGVSGRKFRERERLVSERWCGGEAATPCSASPTNGERERLNSISS